MSDESTCSSIEAQVIDTYSQYQQLYSQTLPAPEFSQSLGLLKTHVYSNPTQYQQSQNPHQPLRLNNFQSQRSLLCLFNHTNHRTQQQVQHSNQQPNLSTNTFDALNNLDSQLPDLPIQKKSVIPLLSKSKPSLSTQQGKNNNNKQL